MSDPALAIDAAQVVQAWNVGAQALLGYREDEVVGRHCYAVLQAEVDGKLFCTPDCVQIQAYRNCTPSNVRSCVVRHRDGHAVEISMSSLLQGNGKCQAAIVILRDQVVAPAAYRPLLRVYSLGEFSVACGDATLRHSDWQRKQAERVLRYLVAFRGRPVHREQLSEWLWPGVPVGRAWHRLRVTIHALRQQLQHLGAAPDIIETIGAAYLLRRDRIWVDADAFERGIADGVQAIEQGRRGQALEPLRAARNLYHGAFMEADRYDEVFDAERNRLAAYAEHLGDLLDPMLSGQT